MLLGDLTALGGVLKATPLYGQLMEKTRTAIKLDKQRLKREKQKLTLANQQLR